MHLARYNPRRNVNHGRPTAMTTPDSAGPAAGKPEVERRAQRPGRRSTDDLSEALRKAGVDDALARKVTKAVATYVHAEIEALRADFYPLGSRRNRSEWCEASYLSLGVTSGFVYPVLEKAGYVKRKGRRFAPTGKAEGLWRTQGDGQWYEWKREETVERVKADLAPLRPQDVQRKLRAEAREKAWEGSELVSTGEIGRRLKVPMSNGALSHLLEGMGYLVKVRSGWVATDKAAAMCVQMDGRSEKPRVLWRKACVDEITSLVGARGAQTR